MKQHAAISNYLALHGSPAILCLQEHKSPHAQLSSRSGRGSGRFTGDTAGSLQLFSVPSALSTSSRCPSAPLSELGRARGLDRPVRLGDSDSDLLDQQLVRR